MASCLIAGGLFYGLKFFFAQSGKIHAFFVNYMTQGIYELIL